MKNAFTGTIRIVARGSRQVLFLALAPILYVQGRRTARAMPRLDPATGDESGLAGGTGPVYRLAVVGESTAVGVGAAVHAEALPGFLAEALRDRFHRSVAWSVTGRSGATARKLLTDLLPTMNGVDPDLVVVTVGINDLIRRRPLERWSTDVTELLTLVRSRFPDAEVVVSGLPPVHRFPAIPRPLRLVLGARARDMDGILRDVAAVGGVTHAPMDESRARDPEVFAADGLHPSPAGYRAWAADLARAVPRMPVRPAPAAFRSAVEAKDLSAITRTLDSAIEFHSPVMVKPYRGRDSVTTLLRVLLQTFEDFHYTDELLDSAHSGAAPVDGAPTRALIFNARVMGKTVQGLDLIEFNDAGLVSRLTVMVRPLPAAMTLARVVGKRMDELAASA